MMNKYDYLIVGAGLYGSLFAYKAKKVEKKVLMIDKRSHIGGNLYCENIEGINVHKYGPHIFHTSNKDVWDFMNSIIPFNHFRYEPLASYKGDLYNLPFNMNTFHQLWNVNTPDEAKSIINAQRKEFEGKEQSVLSAIHRLAEPDSIDLEADLALVAVVGRGMKSTRGTAGRIFSALAHANVNVRMIDQGSSELNVIIGVSNDDFDRAIKAIYDIFVETRL